MPPAVVLAIDPGSSTGWYATGHGGGVHQWLTPTEAKRMDPLDRHAAIFDRYSAWLADALWEVKPTVLVIEAMVARDLKGNAARILCGLRAATLIVTRRHKTLTVEAQQATWKAWAMRGGWTRADKGDANDAQMIHDWFTHAQLPTLREAA